MKPAALLLTLFLLSIFHSVAQNELQWATTFGTADQEYATQICVGDAGESYVAGAYWNDLVLCNDTLPVVNQVQWGNLTQNLFLAKLDSSGNCIWAKAGISAVPASNQGTIAAEILDIRYLDGKVYCTGNFTHTMIFGNDTLYNPTCTDYCTSAFLLALDSSGTVIWSKTFTGTASYSSTVTMIPAADGIYVAGSYQDSLAVDNIHLTGINSWNSSGYILKFDMDGNAVWGQNIGSSGMSGIWEMAYDGDGSLYVAGYFNDTIAFPGVTLHDGLTPVWANGPYFAKYTTEGDFVWAVGGEEHFSGSMPSNGRLTYHPVGCLFFTGAFGNTLEVDNQSFTVAPNFYRDLLLRITTDGEIVWAKETGNRYMSQNFPSAIVPNDAGFLLGSSATHEVVLDGDTIVCQGINDALLTQFDVNGELRHYTLFGGSNQEVIRDIDCTLPYTYLAMRSMSSFTLDGVTIDNQGFQDALICRFGDKASYIGLEETDAASALVLYPNPSSGDVFVAASFTIEELLVTNALGEVVYQAEPHASQAAFSLSVPGIYFVVSQSGRQRAVRKLIVD